MYELGFMIVTLVVFFWLYHITRALQQQDVLNDAIMSELGQLKKKAEN